MLLEGFIGFGSIVAASFFSYLYHFVSVRILSPASYGSLSIIIGLFTVYTIPTQSIQRVVARDVARLSVGGMEGEVSYVFRKTLKYSAFLGLVVGALLVGSSYLVSGVYDEKALVKPIQALGLLVPLWYVSATLKGFVQGRERIVVLGAALILEQVVKVAAAVFLVYSGLGLLGASASIGLGALLVVPLILAYVIRQVSGERKNHELKIKASLMKIIATDVILMAFIYLDVFYVKKMLGSADAGVYNVAALTSKILMYSMAGIMYAFLPKASKLSLKKDWWEIRELMLKSAAILLPLFLVLSLFPAQIVRVSYTEKYINSVPALKILLLGMFTYALFNIPLNLLWSQHEEDFPLMLSVGVLALDAILLHHLIPARGLTGAATATALSSAVLLSASYLKLRRMLLP